MYVHTYICIHTHILDKNLHLLQVMKNKKIEEISKEENNTIQVHHFYVLNSKNDKKKHITDVQIYIYVLIMGDPSRGVFFQLAFF